jgi:DNA-directed RNA polymerase subunit L
VQVSQEDQNCLTVAIKDEDHTLGNALRYVIMKK